jgi:hypothetical protein
MFSLAPPPDSQTGARQSQRWVFGGMVNRRQQLYDK